MSPELFPLSEVLRREACPCRHPIEDHQDGTGKCNSCKCQRPPPVVEETPPHPRNLTDDSSRRMARWVRDYQWWFMELVVWHGVLWFTPWEQNRRPALNDEYRTGLLTGMDITRWVHEHPDWFLIGMWDDARAVRPVALTEAGYEALCHRDLYDMAPVESGLVSPGWAAVPDGSA